MSNTKKTILITGGAGFIGVNSAERFINADWHVIIFDNLSRNNTDTNIEYLEKKYPKKFEFIKGDIRYDIKELEEAANKSSVILHLAAQTAVTTSIEKPLEDLEINVFGTLNVLEAAKKCKVKPLVMYSSTNKVYGNLEEVGVVEGDRRYTFKDLEYGVSENQQMDFHSPYGCSKGAADQYIRDYARIYDLPTVVFRQSCIYGPRQFGVEDQGWVAWFIIAVMLNKPLTIYGNGKQVRDVLYIDDLLDAYQLAAENPQLVKGKIFNLGGGVDHNMSLLEFIEYLEKKMDKKIPLEYSDWRSGDQPLYISDIRKAKDELNWQPKISKEEGIEKLVNWVMENKNLFN